MWGKKDGRVEEVTIYSARGRGKGKKLAHYEAHPERETEGSNLSPPVEEGNPALPHVGSPLQGKVAAGEKRMTAPFIFGVFTKTKG